MNLKIVFVTLCGVISLSECQLDGFWWKNKDLIKSASHSRSLKDQSAKIRTLPPKYRHEDDATTTTTTRKSIFDEIAEYDEEKDHLNYKYDDQPDCVCVPRYLCNQDNILITDGAGIINERSNLCGTDNVCCRLPRATSSTGIPIPQKLPTTTTTTKPYFNFNINNITNLISTILSPVPAHKPSHQSNDIKCISKKGNTLQERVLINLNEDGEEDEDNHLTGIAKQNEYVWMLELLKKNLQKKQFEYKCGAVLISSTTALTANHCLKSKIPANFIIRAGEWDRSSTLEFVPHQDRVVNAIISHPNYYSGGLYNDVAILKFEALNTLQVNVKPLCLPDESDFVLPNTYCTVTAWGSINSTNKSSDKLRFVKLPVVDHATCQRRFQNTRLGSGFKLHESFVCAGGEKDLDTCANDGGSPLVCSNGESYFLYGLVSWGLGCGEKDIPGVYTNIPHLTKWIKRHI